MLTNSFFAPNQIDRELSNNSSLLAKSTIYPNPTNGKLVVELVSDNESTLQIKLFDMKGALLIDKTQKLYVGMNEIKLNLTNYPPAKYLLKLGDDKAFLVRKIILEK